MKSFKTYLGLVVLATFCSLASLEASASPKEIIASPANVKVKVESFRSFDGTWFDVTLLKNSHNDVEFVGVEVKSNNPYSEAYVSPSCEAADFRAYSDDQNKSFVRIECVDLAVRGKTRMIHSLEVQVGANAGKDGALIGPQKVLPSNRVAPIF